MAPPGSSIYELCSFVSVNLCSKNACTAWWWRCKTALPAVVFGLEPFTHVQTAITIIMLSVYSHLPFFSIPQLQGTTSDHVQIFNIELKAKMKSHCMPEQRNKFGRNIIGFRPVIDLAYMRDVVNKLSIRLLDHRFPKAVAQVALTLRSTWEVNLEFRGRVVFNADSVLGTDSRTSMNSQVTKPGNIAEDSSIISAREHVKTSHGSFIHPQGSKELVGSLETEWKTTNQYLLKEHAWLRCTRRCMFALVPQLNDLLRKLEILSLHTTEDLAVMPQTRTSIENTPTTDTGLLSNLHVFLLVHNSHPPPCRLNCMRQQKVLQHKRSTDCVEHSVLKILSLEGYDFLEAIRPREITATG
ncbi:hypothetical protein LguiB_001665 [Lonicera macranthoides]